MKRTVLAVAMIMLLAAAGAYAANPATASFDVTANVAKNCTIAANAISFGSYDPVSANATSPLDATGTLTLNCTKGVIYSIALDSGANGGKVTGVTRAMLGASSGDYLGYELYQDSNHSSVWGSTAGNYPTGTSTSRASVNFTVYGRIPAGQDVGVDASYKDTINVTLNY